MRKLSLILFFILITACNGQKKEVVKSSFNCQFEVSKILSVDSIKFYAKKRNQEYIKNDTIFMLKENDQIYIKSSKLKKENFIRYSIYDKQTLRITRAGTAFIKMPIGCHRFYDNSGKIMKEVDFDENFNFSIDDVIYKLKNVLNFDLNENKPGLGVGRGISKEYNIPVYEIYIIVSKEPYTNRHLVVNGNSGEIILDKVEIAEE